MNHIPQFGKLCIQLFPSISMERMVEKKTESLSREELLEACDILRSIQKECEGQASDPADGLSEAQPDACPLQNIEQK